MLRASSRVVCVLMSNKGQAIYLVISGGFTVGAFIGIVLSTATKVSGLKIMIHTMGLGDLDGYFISCFPRHYDHTALVVIMQNLV